MLHAGVVYMSEQSLSGQALSGQPLSEPKDRTLHLRVKGRTFPLEGGGVLHAVDNVEFSLLQNSFTCIVGPSGCGKTTLLRIILGLDTGFQGTIDKPDDERLAAVFQEPRLLPWRTVEQNIRLVLPKERQEELLDELFDGLELNEVRHLFPGQLSLGLARRAALARAFVVQPQLLILDEPFVSLDDATAIRLRQLLLSLWRQRQTTALMVTHNIREAAILADRILVFSKRPAKVLGELEIDIAQGHRDDEFLDDVVNKVSNIVSG